MEAQQIIDAIKETPALVVGILPTIQETDAFKTLFDNKVDVEYKAKIHDEVKKIHEQYDNDMFEILGVRPDVVDGKKQKTYDKLKELLTDYKGLLGKKDSLTKEAEVLRLQGEIDKLKKEGGAKHVQEVFDKAKKAWEEKESEYNNTIKDLESGSTVFKKEVEIGKAIQGLKLNPDTPDSIKTMAINAAKAELIKNSEFRDGKLVFLDDKGEPIIDTATYQVMSPEGMLANVAAIKDISLKDDSKPGGGADPKIEGSIITSTIEGKEVKKLNLVAGSFTTKAEFADMTEKAMLAQGITRSDPDWQTLQNAAYKEYDVSKLP